MSKYQTKHEVDLDKVDKVIEDLRNHGERWLWREPKDGVEAAFSMACEDAKSARFLLEDAADEITELRERVENLEADDE